MKDLPLAARYQAADARNMNVHDWRIPRSFGDPVAEYRALRSAAGLLDLTFRVRVRVAGADRVAFLQNMLTNDLQPLTAGTGCKSIKLDVRGKIEAKLDVLCMEDALWCDFEPGPAEFVLSALRDRIIMEDVVLEDASEQHTVVSVQGPQAATILNRAGLDVSTLPQELQHRSLDIEGAAIWLVHRDHTGEDGYDLWIPRGAEPLVWSLLSPGRSDADSGLQLVGFEALNMRRMEAGIPWHGAEIQEDRFPQEVGLDEGWINYQKGCYLGQETISRIHHMGHVNRLLCGLQAENDEIPEPGSPVFHEGKEVGRVTSACLSPQRNQPVALAILRREIASASTSVQMGQPDGSAAQVVRLPMS